MRVYLDICLQISIHKNILMYFSMGKDNLMFAPLRGVILKMTVMS